VEILGNTRQLSSLSVSHEDVPRVIPVSRLGILFRVDREKRKLTLLSSKQANAGSIVSQFRKLRLPLKININCSERVKVQVNTFSQNLFSFDLCCLKTSVIQNDNVLAKR